MRTLMFAALGACTLAAPLVAQDMSADELAQAVVALEDEYDEAYAEWRQELMRRSAEYREARKTNPEATYERLAPIEPDFWPRFDAVAAAGSTKAQIWCCSHYPQVGQDEIKEKRADFMRRMLSIIADPEANLSGLTRTIMGRSRAARGQTEALLDADSAKALYVLMENVASDVEVRAEAAYYQVSSVERRDADAEEKKKNLDLYRAVAKNYPDSKWGQRAGGKVFKEERLQIGMVAPEIVGKDVDGNDMKLSDFRGKVTVIDFWGFW